MDDTDQNSRNSSLCCCFRLLRRSNQKINAVSIEEDQVSGPTEQTVSKLEYNPISKEKDSLEKQQDREVKEIDRLRTGIRRLNEELDWLLSDSYVDPRARHSNVSNFSQTKGKTGASPNSKEQQSLATTYSNVVIDMIGAHASPVPVLSFSSSYSETPPASPPQPLPSQGRTPTKPPRPTDGLRMSYTEIFHLLVGQGLITPLPSDTDESLLHSDTVYLQSCEYHKGNRAHSTENCIQLRFQVRKFIKDGLLKIEPPKVVVADQNNSSVPSSDKVSSDPVSLLVSNGKETGHSIVKEELDCILQEMNSPNHQLSRQQKKEMNMPQKQIRKKHKKVELLKKTSNFEVSNEGQIEQTVPKEEYDRVFQEVNSLKNQLSQISSEINSLKHISEKQEQAYLSKAGFQVPKGKIGQSELREEYYPILHERNSLTNELDRLRSYWFPQTTGNNMSQKRDMKRAGQNSSKEQQPLLATCSNIVSKYQNGEKALFSLSVPLAFFLFCCLMVGWLCFKVGVAIRVYLA